MRAVSGFNSFNSLTAKSASSKGTSLPLPRPSIEFSANPVKAASKELAKKKADCSSIGGIKILYIDKFIGSGVNISSLPARKVFTTFKNKIIIVYNYIKQVLNSISFPSISSRNLFGKKMS